MTNLANMYEGRELPKKVSENEMAISYMRSKLSSLGERHTQDPVELYANTVIEAITDLNTKEERSSKDYDVMLKYLDRLDGIMGITKKDGIRDLPVEAVVLSGDDLTSYEI